MTPIRPLGALLVALTTAAIATGCGADEGTGTPSSAAGKPATTGEVVPVDVDGDDPARAGSVAQLADCAYWRQATREQRFATIADIRGQHTPQQSESAASPLSDERAYAVFERACKPDFAGSLRLYKLYVRVQGFAPLSE